jgi:hypothetical protein
MDHYTDIRLNSAIATPHRRTCSPGRGDSGGPGSEIGSSEGTAEESPPAGRATDETDYFRLADNSEVFIGASRRNGKNQQTVDARFRNKRSKLHGPPPVLARYRKMKQ